MEWKGKPLSIILDLVKVAKVNTLPDCSQLLSWLYEQSHSGVNLAAAFAKILEDFGISDKVI